MFVPKYLLRRWLGQLVRGGFRVEHVVIGLSLGLPIICIAICLSTFVIGIGIGLLICFLVRRRGDLGVRLRSESARLEITDQITRRVLTLILQRLLLDILHGDAHHLYRIVNHVHYLICVNAVDVGLFLLSLLAAGCIWVVPAGGAEALRGLVLESLPEGVLATLDLRDGLPQRLGGHGVRRPVMPFDLGEVNILNSDFQIIQILVGRLLGAGRGHGLTWLQFCWVGLVVWVDVLLLVAVHQLG